MSNLKKYIQFINPATKVITDWTIFVTELSTVKVKFNPANEKITEKLLGDVSIIRKGKDNLV